MKYSQEEIQKAREVPLQSILGFKGGRRGKIRCPIHNEKTPSLTIYSDGSWFCFGCSAHGRNAIDFLTAIGETFPEAVEFLLSGSNYVKIDN